jgi:hypothetical protein
MENKGKTKTFPTLQDGLRADTEMQIGVLVLLLFTDGRGQRTGTEITRRPADGGLLLLPKTSTLQESYRYSVTVMNEKTKSAIAMTNE